MWRPVLCPAYRQLPLFHLCRPLVMASKKELALFRVFEGLPVLPTQPFLFYRDILPFLAEGNKTVSVFRSPCPSVRWLLQQFLFGLQKDNAAVIHNLLSASGKLELFFGGWKSDTRKTCTVARGVQPYLASH